MNDNEGQKSSLQELRESIEKRKANATRPDFNEHITTYDENYGSIELSMIVVEEVKEPSENVEFDLERYTQLTRKVDALYNNYLVSKQEYIKASENMANQLKELAKALDDTLNEGTKPRWK